MTTRRGPDGEILSAGEMAMSQIADYWNMVQVKCDYCGAEPLVACKNKGRPTPMPHFGSRQQYGEWNKEVQMHSNRVVDSIRSARFGKTIIDKSKPR